MPLPQSEGFEDRFRALERKVNDLFTSIQNRSGTVVASQGWLLRSMSGPSTPPTGDVYIYASGGRLWARSSLGDVVLEPVEVPELPQAADVGGMDGLSTPNSWPTTYNNTYGERVQDDLEMIRVWVLQLRTNLRDAGLMA